MIRLSERGWSFVENVMGCVTLKVSKEYPSKYGDEQAFFGFQCNPDKDKVHTPGILLSAHSPVTISR